jgi:hypothetical protein
VITARFSPYGWIARNSNLSIRCIDEVTGYSNSCDKSREGQHNVRRVCICFIVCIKILFLLRLPDFHSHLPCDSRFSETAACPHRTVLHVRRRLPRCSSFGVMDMAPLNYKLWVRGNAIRLQEITNSSLI